MGGNTVYRTSGAYTDSRFILSLCGGQTVATFLHDTWAVAGFELETVAASAAGSHSLLTVQRRSARGGSDTDPVHGHLCN